MPYELVRRWSKREALPNNNYNRKNNIRDAQRRMKVITLENNTTFDVYTRLQGHLHGKSGLHRAQPTIHPFARGRAVTQVYLRLDSRGREDAVVGLGEGPDSGIGGRSSSDGTKLVACIESLSSSVFDKERTAYG
jgi:hypothetical protein